MRTKEVKLYQFCELSETAKNNAINNLRDINTDGDYWFESIFDDAKEIGKLMGIDISNIYFRGFAYQGDGACFEGKYAYAKNSVKAVKEYAPEDETLHAIVKGLYEIQKRYSYKINATVKHSGYYYHSMCTDLEIYLNDNGYLLYLPEKDDAAITELLCDFMDWIYKMLNTEFDYQSTNDAIIATIEANGYDFTEDGELDS
jgi:hypothetical protein